MRLGPGYDLDESAILPYKTHFTGVTMEWLEKKQMLSIELKKKLQAN